MKRICNIPHSGKPYLRTFLMMNILLFYVPDFWAQAQLSDCTGAIEVCGNGAISSNASGFGLQEVGPNNSCSSMEHNSLWIRIEITKTGTLGFILKPTDPSILIDYDFFVFGPNATCGDLGTTIRCSTTNPNAAGLANNFTGMRDEEPDLSEGPGLHGDSFVKSLDVLPGETYYIVIDRPIGQSPFVLEWTGTSTLDGSPFPEGVEANKPEDLEQCGINGTAEFDVLSTRSQINEQPQISVTYYPQLEDAVDQTREITGNYSSSSPRKTIYARVENELTGCYEIVDFDLVVLEGPPALAALTYELCDYDRNGTEAFDLNTQISEILSGLNPETHILKFFASSEEAENNQNDLSTPYLSEGEEIVYARVEEKDGFGCFTISEISLQLNSPSELTEAGPGNMGFQISSNTVSVLIPEQNNYQYSLDDPNGPYQESILFEAVKSGLHVIYTRAKDRCAITSAEVIVPGYKDFFTPNGDGFNDHWSVETGDYLKFTEPVRIFDRYEKLLAEIRPNTSGWDGSFDGKDLPSDDYWYDFTLPFGQRIRGHFSLIR